MQKENMNIFLQVKKDFDKLSNLTASMTECKQYSVHFIHYRPQTFSHAIHMYNTQTLVPKVSPLTFIFNSLLFNIIVLAK